MFVHFLSSISINKVTSKPQNFSNAPFVEGVETKYEELHGNWLKKVSKTVKEFNYKMENNAQRYQHTIMNPQIVREFPMDLLKAMAHDSTQPSKGPWTVSLHPYIYKQFLAYCPDRQLRYSQLTNLK